MMSDGPLQCGQDEKDGEVDLDDHVDVEIGKYENSLAARR